MSAAQPAPLPEQTRQRLVALAQGFVDQANAIGATHLELLQALNVAYVAIAETHPCCTAAAADTALRSGQVLAQLAAAANTAATHVH